MQQNTFPSLRVPTLSRGGSGCFADFQTKTFRYNSKGTGAREAYDARIFFR